MARLDLFRVRTLDGYLLEVQADLMKGLATTVVVPLRPLTPARRPIALLNPVLDIDGARWMMETQSLAAVPRKSLGPAVGHLAPAYHDAVSAALDMLFVGF